MAQKRDVIDDLIDIQSDWKAVKNPLGGLAGSLAVDPDNENFYDPSDYKERPRANSLFCTPVRSEERIQDRRAHHHHEERRQDR